MGRHKINASYLLPKTAYYRTLWSIRDAQRLREQYRDLLEESAAPADGQPRGTQTGDPTAQKAAKLEKLHDQIAPIDEALKVIPEEYRKGVMANILYHAPYPSYAGINTWKRAKQRFVYEAAVRLGYTQAP